MRSFRDVNPYLVGIISVLAIGAITGFAFAIGLTHFLEHAYPLKAEFRDAAGLREGDSVRVAGVKVGRVTGIRPERTKGLVVVTFVVNQGIEVHDKVNADVALETLLGAKYVRLSQVMSGDSILEDLPSSDDRRTIPVERTTTPFDLFDLTRRATEGIQRLDTKALNDTIHELAAVTDGKQASIRDLIGGIDKVAAAINARDAELRQLLDRADTFTKTLADKDQTLVRLIDDSRQILELLASRKDQLATTLGAGSDVVTRLAQIIGQHRAELDSILDTLHPTLDVVAAEQAHLDKALPWIGPAFYNQTLAGTHGPWLDIYVNSLGADPRALFCNLLAGGAPACTGP